MFDHLGLSAVQETTIQPLFDLLGVHVQAQEQSPSSALNVVDQRMEQEGRF